MMRSDGRDVNNKTKLNIFFIIHYDDDPQIILSCKTRDYLA
jgi:hypothetical protein